ncbi:MAG TPA: metal-dependent transcriptional regulator [Ferruginibacter sp.]|nr:metal-dependent transcriptional regulator [Ferruginibacter sp.]HRN78777.1 metal-dependent transcriptional regulator [Ferruginibacter sp.]HRO16798.1 metal-dependent transcriptional regulator [Ferruginibacter sp.]HRQ20334.1 metal-dependent transcriptional regulator [Ferruginibacter sp.]
MLSITEENYLKALFRLTCEEVGKTDAGTNEIAAQLDVKPATASDMLRKLKEKKLIEYEKYGKSMLTRRGKKMAMEIVRKHRLWETFLYEKLGFTWDEVHEVAEQLEHIQSQKLIERLNTFLGNPKYDPHGDLIPQADGEFKLIEKKTLNDIAEGETCLVVGVSDNSAEFLQYVDGLSIAIHRPLKVVSRKPFDAILEIEVKGKRSAISARLADHIFVSREVKKAAKM